MHFPAALLPARADQSSGRLRFRLPGTGAGAPTRPLEGARAQEGGRTFFHESPTMPDPILLFAKVDHRLNHGRVFGIRAKDLTRHVYVIGKTGTGKTVLLERLLVAVIRGGGGCALLDPHGDLAERLLDFIPRSRTNDVVVFDPSDLAQPVGLNLLEHVSENERHLVASAALSVFRKLFADAWGPRTEHVLRHVLRALLDVRGSTLLGVPRMLLDERYRERVLRQVTDPVTNLFWTREFPMYPKAFLAEVLAPVENKVMALLASPPVRSIVGQHSSTIVPRAILDQGGILLANLAKGRIGEDASRLLGAVLVTKLELAAWSRADLPESARTPFLLAIDEFASFVTESFAGVVTEGRKYGLALLLAHQHLGQLDDELRQAVVGNAGTLVAFRLGAEDATGLGGEFLPQLSPHDLTRLARHQIAIRLAVDGVMSEPFTAETLPPHEEGERTGQRDTIRRISRERYGTPARRVREMIERQLHA